MIAVHETAVRAWVDLPRKRHRMRSKRQIPWRSAPFWKRVLVFDTETTTDFLQRLLYGIFHIYDSGQLIQEGIVLGDSLSGCSNQTEAIRNDGGGGGVGGLEVAAAALVQVGLASWPRSLPTRSSHLGEAALDGGPEIGVGLDAADRHHQVAREHRFAYVDRQPSAELPDLFDFHRGFARDFEPSSASTPSSRSTSIARRSWPRHGSPRRLSTERSASRPLRRARDYDGDNLGEPAIPRLPRATPTRSAPLTCPGYGGEFSARPPRSKAKGGAGRYTSNQSRSSTPGEPAG